MSEAEKMPKATHSGKITLGDVVLPCAVLEDGTRVISERGMTKVLGGKRGGAHWVRKKETGANLPVFVSAKNLQAFIDKDLEVALTKPIIYKTKTGAIANGVNATLIPQICDVWLRARDARVLFPSQEHLAVKADILMRGLAHVGIIALVDEATGYQEERDRNELQKFLAMYLSEERLTWARMFPEEYYRQLFRLRGWTYSPLSVKRPKYVGQLTNELANKKLPAPVLEELKKLNPVKNKKTWRREAMHHQHLSADLGQPDLRDHLLQLIAIMRISPNWAAFIRNFNRAFPGAEEQIEMFEEDDEAAIGLSGVDHN